MFILTLATRSAGQKVNAAGQKPPQRNKKKYAMSLFSGLLFNLSNPRDSEHSLFKTTITYWLTSAFLLSCSLRDWQLLLCSLKRGWEYFLKSHPILSLLKDTKSPYIALSASCKFVGTLIHVPQLNSRSFLIWTPIPIPSVGLER